MSEEKKFSFLYKDIVDTENDMIGHIAYSLYKQSKIEFIKSIKAENGGRQPTQSELDTFHKVSKTSIPALRIQAEQILFNFTELTLKESIAEIEKDMLTNQQKILSDIIDPIKPGPPKGTWDGFMMAVLVKGAQTLVVAIFIFLVIFGSSAMDDFWGTVRKWIPEPEQKNSPTPKTGKKPTISFLHHR